MWLAGWKGLKVSLQNGEKNCTFQLSANMYKIDLKLNVCSILRFRRLYRLPA